MPFICNRCGLDMKGFRNWRVGVKLVAGFLVVAAIAAVIGGLGLRSTSQVNQMAVLMYDQEVAGIRHASQAQLRLVAAGRAARAVLLAPDKGARIGELYAMRDHLEGARTETEKLHVLMADPDFAKRWGVFMPAVIRLPLAHTRLRSVIPIWRAGAG